MRYCLLQIKYENKSQHRKQKSIREQSEDIQPVNLCKAGMAFLENFLWLTWREMVIKHCCMSMIEQKDMRAPATSSPSYICYSSRSDGFERSVVVDKIIISDEGPYEGLESGCVL